MNELDKDTVLVIGIGLAIVGILGFSLFFEKEITAFFITPYSNQIVTTTQNYLNTPNQAKQIQETPGTLIITDINGGD